MSHRTLTIHEDTHAFAHTDSRTHAPVTFGFEATEQTVHSHTPLSSHVRFAMTSVEQQLQTLMQQQQHQDAQFQLLVQQNQMLQQQLQAAQQAHVHPAPLPVAVSAQGGRRIDRPRLPAPKKFDGRSTTLDAWVTECTQQFEWYDMTDDVERVKFAVAFMEGAAYDWWQHMQPMDRQLLQTFPQLVASLRTRFQPVTTADSARAAITSISQGKSTVHTYTMAFRRLLTPLDDMSEADRLFHFLRGLKPSIAITIRTHGVDTLDKAISMAARVGSQGEFAAIANNSTGAAPANGATPMDLDALHAVEGLELETGGGPDSHTSSSSSTPTAQQFQELLALMKGMRGRRPVSNSSASSSKRMSRDSEGRVKYGNLSREEMDSRFASNSCFHCNKPGHRAAQCRSAQKEGEPQQKK